jgi:hypothetical protein
MRRLLKRLNPSFFRQMPQVASTGAPIPLWYHTLVSSAVLSNWVRYTWERLLYKERVFAAYSVPYSVIRGSGTTSCIFCEPHVLITRIHHVRTPSICPDGFISVPGHSSPPYRRKPVEPLPRCE